MAGFDLGSDIILAKAEKEGIRAAAAGRHVRASASIIDVYRRKECGTLANIAGTGKKGQ